MKKVVIIMIVMAVVAIVAVGGFGGYNIFKYCSRDDEMKVTKIPDYYENLKWGSSYKDVYNDILSRGETISKETTNDRLISTYREDYENVKGIITIHYEFDNGGLSEVNLKFKKSNCKPKTKKIFNNYKKRLDKYCHHDYGFEIWTNKNDTMYCLDQEDDYVLYMIQCNDKTVYKH